MSIPSWRDQLPQSFVGARKWGTGINPVHSISEDGRSFGRNLAPGPYNPMRGTDTVIIGEDWSFVSDDEYGDSDMSYTEAHPNLGEAAPRAQMDFPPWGLQAGGTGLRTRKVGMAWKEQEPLQVPIGPAGYGWENKRHLDTPLDSTQSDESQLYINTSQVQRDKVQDNSRAVTRGTDDPRHPIATRTRGMRTKVWSGGQRHEDMLPRTQDGPHRPFLYRQAQAGPANYPDWIAVNEMYVSQPIQRQLPPDVDMGQFETNDMTPDYMEGEDFFYG